MTIKALNKAEEKEYAPKEGDTLEKIAKKEEMTWRELALYNWRTVVPNEVNRALFETIGCESIDAKNPGKTVLSPKNGPKTAGKILTPKVWIMKEDEIEPDKTYAVTLKKQSPPLSPLGISKLDKWFIPKQETCDIKYRLDGRGEDVNKMFCEVYGSKYCEASDWNEGRGTYSELEKAVLFSKEADKPPVGSEAFASFESERWRGETNAKKGILSFKNEVGEDSREERFINVAFSPYTVVVKHFKDDADAKAAIELFPFWPQFKEDDGTVVADSLILKWKVHETEKLKLGALLIWDKDDKLVFSTPLEAADHLKKDAESKFEWDGKYNEGLHWDQTEHSKPENGDGEAEISAKDMPYRFQIQAHSDYKEEEGEEGKDLSLAAMHTEVRLYVHPKTSPKTKKNYDPFEEDVSMNLRLGSLTPDEKAPATEGDKDWFQYKLAEAGYHPGPADGEDRDDFKWAVKEFQRSVPKEKTGDEYERLTVSDTGDTDDDTKKAIKSMDAKYKRPWFADENKKDYPPDDADKINPILSDKDKKLVVWVDARHYYTKATGKDADLIKDSVGDYHDDMDIGDKLIALDAKIIPRPWLPLAAEPMLLSKTKSLSDEIIISEDNIAKTKHCIGPLRIDWTFEDLKADFDQIDSDKYDKVRVRTYKYVSWTLDKFKKEHDYKNPDRKVKLFNCPEASGGIRPDDLSKYFQAAFSNDEKTSLQPWIAVPDDADKSIVTVLHDNIDGEADNIKAKQIGRGGVYFRPSIIGGDGYRVRAQIQLKKLAGKYEFPNLENLEKRYERLPQALSAGFRIWRKSSIRGHLLWSSKVSRFNEYMPEINALYGTCHVHFVHEGGSPNQYKPSDLVDAGDQIDLGKYKTIITERIADYHKNNPDLIELSDKYCFPWFNNKDVGQNFPPALTKPNFKKTARGGSSIVLRKDNSIIKQLKAKTWSKINEGMLLHMMTRVEKQHGLLRGHLLVQFQDTKALYAQIYKCDSCDKCFWYLERDQAGGGRVGKKCSACAGKLEIVKDYEVSLKCSNCNKVDKEDVLDKTAPAVISATKCPICNINYAIEKSTEMNLYRISLECSKCKKTKITYERASAAPAATALKCKVPCNTTYTLKNSELAAPIKGPLKRSAIAGGGVGLSGGVTWLPNDARDPVTKQPNDGFAAWEWVHEMGHHRHLEHAADAPGSKGALHDSEDNSYETVWGDENKDINKRWDRACVMSYVDYTKGYDPDKDKPYFCGKCVLRNRGWKVETFGSPGKNSTDPVSRNKESQDGEEDVLLPLNKVTPKIALSDQALWFDPTGSEPEEDSRKAKPVKLVLSFDQTSSANPFEGAGTLEVPANLVDVYKDEACETAFDSAEKIDFSAERTVYLYLKGKNEGDGEIILKLEEPDPDSNIELAKETAEERIEVKEDRVWVEIQLAWKSGNPIPNEKYLVIDKEGQRHAGTLDDQGFALIDNLRKGECEVDFPDIIFKEDGKESERLSDDGDYVYSLGKGPTVCQTEIRHAFQLEDWNINSLEAEGTDIVADDVEEGKVWIEIQLAWKGGDPFPDEKYLVIDKEGRRYSGTLDQRGFARIADLPEGECEIDFPGITFESGSEKSELLSDDGDRVYLLGKGPTVCQTETRNVFQLEDWEVESLEAVGTDAPEDEVEEGKVWIEIQLAWKDGDPIPDEKYLVVDKERRRHSGTLDQRGSARIGNLPEGDCRIEFPGISFESGSEKSELLSTDGDRVYLLGKGQTVCQTETRNVFQLEDWDIELLEAVGTDAPENEVEEGKVWIEIQLAWKSGDPISDEKYLVIDKERRRHSGTLNQRGFARIANLPEGEVVG